MKKIFVLIFSLFLVACLRDKKPVQVEVVSKTKPLENKPKQQTIIPEKAYPLLVDSLIIDSQKFIVIQNDPRSETQRNLCILNEAKDSIYIHEGYATNGFELEDFDNNGILDIRLYQITNVGGISELVFYDKEHKTFKTVKDFDNFPEPTKVKNTKYWCSYHRSGCADSNWGSELFKIENFKAIKIGEIEGIGCENEKKMEYSFILLKAEKEKKYSQKKEILAIMLINGISLPPIGTITSPNSNDLKHLALWLS